MAPDQAKVREALQIVAASLALAAHLVPAAVHLAPVEQAQGPVLVAHRAAPARLRIRVADQLRGVALVPVAVVIRLAAVARMFPSPD